MPFRENLVAGALLLVASATGGSRAVAQERLTAAQTLGRYISAGLVMLGPRVTQDSLAKWWRSSGTVRARSARIGLIRSGLVMPADSDLLSLAVMMDTLWRNRADTSVERRATALYRQARIISRRPPAVAAAPAASAPAPVPGPAQPDQRRLPITGQRVARDAAGRGTYRLDVAQHGLTTGQAIRVLGHGATPSLEGWRYWVQAISANSLWLWADSARTVPVRVRTLGSGGVIEVLR